jgi:hypothetical protein
VSARLEIVSGGRPSDAELAAIVVALTPGRDDEATDSPRLAGWHRAAILEGVGERPFSSAADLWGTVLS